VRGASILIASNPIFTANEAAWPRHRAKGGKGLNITRDAPKECTTSPMKLFIIPIALNSKNHNFRFLAFISKPMF